MGWLEKRVNVMQTGAPLGGAGIVAPLRCVVSWFRATDLVGLTASPRGVWARGRCGNWIIFLAGSGQWGPIAIQPKGDSKCHRCVCG